MAHPPYSRMEEEAQIWFHKSYEDLTEDQQNLCEDMAWEYCGMSPIEAAEEEYRQKHGCLYDD